jgi:mono/diheme cytochrome c family protein
VFIGVVRALRVQVLIAGTLVAVAGLSTAAEGQETALSRFQEHKAEAMLRDRLPCLGCHTLNGEGGRIGPDLTSVRTRRSADYIAAMVKDPQATVPGSVMPRITMPDATRDLVVRYLATRRGGADAGAPAAGPPSPALPRADAADGPALYTRYCAACHGTAGSGDGPNAAFLPVRPAALASREAMSLRSDDALFDTISGGGEIMNRSPRMPPWGATLTRAEIGALVRHIRSLCRCTGPGWSTGGGGRAP